MAGTNSPEKPGSPEWLPSGGELGALIHVHDWSRTGLGPLPTWPQSLRSAMSICLNARFPIALYWGEDLTLLYNDAWSPIPGAKHPWSLGRTAREVWPEIWDTIGPLFEQVAATGEGVWLEDQLLPMHRHGYTEECYFNFTFSPVLGERGGVAGIFNAVIETTYRVLNDRRTRLLQELAGRTSTARSDGEVCRRAAECLAGEHLPEARRDVPFALLYLLDAETREARLTGAAGVDPGTAISPPVVPLNSDEGVWPFSRVSESLAAEVISGLAAELEPLGMGPWPETPHTAVVLPIKSAGVGSVAGFAVLGVSARRALDEDYLRFLEQVGSHLSTALVNARAYEEERKRAEALAEIDRAKTLFFSNVSHEFRTPLTLMLGPVEELLAKPEDGLRPENRELLQVVHRNTQRLQKLVNSLLDFSRIEAGRVQASYTATNLGELTADLASTFRSAIEKAGLRLVVQCDDPLPQAVYVDREMWEKIVLNLLSNAFKYTFEGEIAVALRDAGDCVELAVRDTGTGIPAHALPHIFERFQRVENVRARTHEGTGIGLALVRELVRLHGGEVRVDSREEEGSTFSVTIPYGTDHLPSERIEGDRNLASTALAATAFVHEALRWIPGEGENGPEVPPEPLWESPLDRPLSVASPRTRRARIVLADDNADMRDYVRRLLSPYYEVTAVPDGQAALAAVREAPPDLVIADVMMPQLDGFGLLEALRTATDTATLPFILLSARAGEEARLEGLERGADDYLTKPFSARELLTRVSAHLALSRVRRETAQQLAELNQALQQKVDEFETLLEVLPVGIGIASDRECRNIRINPAFAAILGLDPQANASKTAPEGERPTSFRCFDDSGREVPDDELPMQVAAREGRTVSGIELNILRQDGRTIRLLEYAVPLLDARGEPRGCVGAFVDITQRREAEEALKEADRRKDEFLAMLAHELRNPLAPIRTAVRLLQLQGEAAPHKERQWQIIERQVANMARLLDDLLDVSRITRGLVRLHPETVDLSAAVSQALEATGHLIVERHHELTVSLEPALYVDGDRLRLEQVVTNLVSNAAKYTDPGGTIRVMTYCEGDEAVLRVADTGMGMSPELLPHVFELFTQGDRTIDRSQGGLGIGLKMVRSLVELHGGSVEAASPGPGLGSAFTIRLPLFAKPAAANGGGPAIPESPGTATSFHPCGRGRVLVVDDNRDGAESLCELIRLWGYECRAAHDGLAALQTARDFRPDAVVLDIGMPGLDGYEVAHHLRQEPSLAGAHLIALTGYGREEDRDRSIEAGFDRHLTKPTDPREVERILAELLHSPSSR